MRCARLIAAILFLAASGKAAAQDEGWQLPPCKLDAAEVTGSFTGRWSEPLDQAELQAFASGASEFGLRAMDALNNLSACILRHRNEYAWLTSPERLAFALAGKRGEYGLANDPLSAEITAEAEALNAILREPGYRLFEAVSRLSSTAAPLASLSGAWNGFAARAKGGVDEALLSDMHDAQTRVLLPLMDYLSYLERAVPRWQRAYRTLAYEAPQLLTTIFVRKAWHEARISSAEAWLGGETVERALAMFLIRENRTCLDGLASTQQSAIDGMTELSGEPWLLSFDPAGVAAFPNEHLIGNLEPAWPEECALSEDPETARMARLLYGPPPTP